MNKLPFVSGGLSDLQGTWTHLQNGFRTRLLDQESIDCFDRCLDNEKLIFQVAISGKPVTAQQLDVIRLIHQIKVGLQPLQNNRDVALQIDGTGPCGCTMNRARAYCAIWCLMVDAVIASPRLSVVEINVLKYRQDLEIEICDAGTRSSTANEITRSSLLPLVQKLLPTVIVSTLNCPQGGVALQLTIPASYHRMAA